MSRKFSTLPYTFRDKGPGYLVVDAIEQFRVGTQSTFSWFAVLLSPELFFRLERETPRPIYDFGGLRIYERKIYAVRALSDELPPNSIIQIEEEVPNE